MIVIARHGSHTEYLRDGERVGLVARNALQPAEWWDAFDVFGDVLAHVCGGVNGRAECEQALEARLNGKAWPAVKAKPPAYR